MTFPVIRPRKWDEFQHYKDRCPPWVKLHRALLDDYDYSCLPLASKAIAPLLWLLASEHKAGEIVLNKAALAFRLHITVDELEQGLAPLIKSGFFQSDQDCSNMLAECKQDARPETEAEREAESKTEKKLERETKVRKASPSGPDTAETWAAYSKAYETRYRIAPIRNAQVNSKIKQFVQKVGSEEAPAIAAYFVSHNSSYYIGRGHAVGNMLTDAEKLRTEWATGNAITQTKARQMDKTASNPFLQILSEMKNEQS